MNKDEGMKTRFEEYENDNVPSRSSDDERNIVFTESGSISSSCFNGQVSISLTGNKDGQEPLENTNLRTVIHEETTMPIYSDSDLKAEERELLKTLAKEHRLNKNAESAVLSNVIDSSCDLVSKEVLNSEELSVERIENNDKTNKDITDIHKKDMVTKEETVADISMEENEDSKSNREIGAYISIKQTESAVLSNVIDSSCDLISKEVLNLEELSVERIENNDKTNKEITDIHKEDMVTKEETVADISMEENEDSKSNREIGAYISIKQKDDDKTVAEKMMFEITEEKSICVMMEDKEIKEFIVDKVTNDDSRTEEKSAHELINSKEMEMNSLINLRDDVANSMGCKDVKNVVEETVSVYFRPEDPPSDLTSKCVGDETQNVEEDIEGNIDVKLIGNEVASTDSCQTFIAPTSSSDCFNISLLSACQSNIKEGSDLKSVANPGAIAAKNVPESIIIGKDSNYFNPSLNNDKAKLISDNILNKSKGFSHAPTGPILNEKAEFKEEKSNYSPKYSGGNNGVSFPESFEVSAIRENSSTSVASEGSFDSSSAVSCTSLQREDDSQAKISVTISNCPSTKEDSSANSHMDKIFLENKESISKNYERSSLENDMPLLLYDKDIKYDMAALDSQANSYSINELIENDACIKPLDSNFVTLSNNFSREKNSGELNKDSMDVLQDHIRITYPETSVKFHVTEIPSVKLDEDFQDVNVESSSSSIGKPVSFSASMEDESEISHTFNYKNTKAFEKSSFDSKIMSLKCSPTNILYLSNETEKTNVPSNPAQKNNFALSKDVTNIACDSNDRIKLGTLTTDLLNLDMNTIRNQSKVSEIMIKGKEYKQASMLPSSEYIAVLSNSKDKDKVIQQSKILTEPETGVLSSEHEMLKLKQINFTTPSDLNLVETSISGYKTLSATLKPNYSTMVSNSNPEMSLRGKLDLGVDKAFDVQQQTLNLVAPKYSMVKDEASLMTPRTNSEKVHCQYGIDKKEICFSPSVKSMMGLKVETQQEQYRITHDSDETIDNFDTDNLKQALSSGNIIVDLKTNLALAKDYLCEKSQLRVTHLVEEVDNEPKSNSGINESNGPLSEQLDKGAKLIHENQSIKDDTVTLEMDKPSCSLDQSNSNISSILDRNNKDVDDISCVEKLCLNSISEVKKYELLEADNVDVIMEDVEVVFDKSFLDANNAVSTNQSSDCADSETSIASCPDSKSSIISVTNARFTHSTNDCNMGLYSGPSDCKTLVRSLVSDDAFNSLGHTFQVDSGEKKDCHRDIRVGSTRNNCAVNEGNRKPMLAHSISSSEAVVNLPCTEKDIVIESANRKKELVKIGLRLPHLKRDVEKSHGTIHQNDSLEMQVNTPENEFSSAESLKDFSFLDITVQLSNEGLNNIMDSSVKDKYVLGELEGTSKVSHIILGNSSSSKDSLYCISNKSSSETSAETSLVNSETFKAKSSALVESNSSPIIDSENFSKVVSILEIDSFSEITFDNKINFDNPIKKLDINSQEEIIPVCIIADPGESPAPEWKAVNPDITLKQTQISSGDSFGATKDSKNITDAKSKMISINDMETHTEHLNKSSSIDTTILRAISMSDNNDMNEVANKSTLMSSDTTIEKSFISKSFINTSDKKLLSSVNLLDHCVSKNINQICGMEIRPVSLIKTNSSEKSSVHAHNTILITPHPHKLTSKEIFPESRTLNTVNKNSAHLDNIAKPNYSSDLLEIPSNLENDGEDEPWPLIEKTVIKAAHTSIEDDFEATSNWKTFNDVKKRSNINPVIKVKPVSDSNTFLSDRTIKAAISLTQSQSSNLSKHCPKSREGSLVSTSHYQNCAKIITHCASEKNRNIVISESKYSNPITYSAALISEAVPSSSNTTISKFTVVSNIDSVGLSDNEDVKEINDSEFLNKINLEIASGSQCSDSVGPIINASSFMSKNALSSTVPILHEQISTRNLKNSRMISNSVVKYIVEISDTEPNTVEAIVNSAGDISLSTEFMTKTFDNGMLKHSQALHCEPLSVSSLTYNTSANQNNDSSILLPLSTNINISEEQEPSQVIETNRKDINNLTFLSPVSMTDNDSNNKCLSIDSCWKPVESAVVDNVPLIDSKFAAQRPDITITTMHNSGVSSSNIIVEYSESSSSSDLDDSLECNKSDLSNICIEKYKVSKKKVFRPIIAPLVFDESISSLDLTLSNITESNKHAADVCYKADSKSVENIPTGQTVNNVKAPNSNILLVDYSESSSDCDTSIEVSLDSSMSKETQNILPENFDDEKKFNDIKPNENVFSTVDEDTIDTSNSVKNIIVMPVDKIRNCDDLGLSQHTLKKSESCIYQTDEVLKKKFTVCKNGIASENCEALFVGDVNKNNFLICKKLLITSQTDRYDLNVDNLEKDLDRTNLYTDEKELDQHTSLIKKELCVFESNVECLPTSKSLLSELECNYSIKKSELPQQEGISSYSNPTKSTSSLMSLGKRTEQDNSGFIKKSSEFSLCSAGTDISTKKIRDSELSTITTLRRSSNDQILDPSKFRNEEGIANENMDEDTCDISLVGVQNFDWDGYLEETNSESTPPTAFLHVEQSLETGIEDGQFVEVLSNCIPFCENATETNNTTDVATKNITTTYWPAKVLSSCGLLLRLRYEIVPYARGINLEFWKDLSIKNNNLKPLGWSKAHQIPLRLPIHLSSTMIADSCDINIDPCLSVPQESFEQDRCEIFARINSGTLLEVQDSTCPFEGWVARVIENHGGLLLLELLNSEDFERKVWMFFSDSRIRPLHWFKEQGKQYRYKFPDSFSILKNHIENQPSLSFLQTLQPNLIKHNLIVGMYMEAVLPTTSQTIHVASVSKVFDEFYFELNIDGYHWVTTANDPLIFPINFCKNNGITLTPPKESTVINFEWEEFLTSNSYLAVNPETFGKQTLANDLGFQEDQKLEAVNPLNEGQICKATVKKVTEHLLVIQVSPEFSFYRGASSNMLFPVGWSLANQLELYVPQYVHKRKCIGNETCNQELTSTMEVKSEDRCLKSESTNQNSLWCDRLYINHCCYAGPYLSKSKIAKLSQSVGPGPVNLVLREVLGRTINAGYVPTRVLKELKRVSCVNPSWRPIALKAKFRRHTLKTSVNIAITARDVDAFLMEFSKTLLCCHNLWSFKLSGEICPYDCNGLAFSTAGNVANKGRGGCRGSQARRKRGKKRLLYPMKTAVNSEETERQVDDEEDDDEGEEPCSGSEVEGASRPSSPLLDMQRKMKQKRLLSSLEIHMNEPKIADSSPGHKLRGGIKRRNDAMELRETTFSKEGNPPNAEEENSRKRAKAELKRASNNPYSLEPAKVDSDPLDWSVKDVENYILSQPSICHHAVRLREHEVDGRAFMLLNLPTLVHYLNLPHSSAVTLAQHICKVKLAHFVNFQT